MEHDAQRRAVLRLRSHPQLDPHVLWKFLERTSFMLQGAVAGAAVIAPCRDARRGFLFALYVPTEVMENYGLIYWQKKKCKHCVAEMPFASWIACWCLLSNLFFVSIRTNRVAEFP